MIMILHDSLMVLTSGMLFISTLIFFYLIVLGLNQHNCDVISYDHFLEHAIAAGFVAIGTLFLLVNDVRHLFSIDQDASIEFPETTPELLLRIGILLFLAHMIKEQTSVHPFYVHDKQDNQMEK